MRTAGLVSTGAAALIAITLFSAAPVDARRGGGGISRGGGGHSIGRASRVAHRAPAMRRAPSHSRQRVHHRQGQRKHVASGKKVQSAQRKHNKSAGTARKQIHHKQAGSAKRNIAAGGAALAAGAIAGKGAARNLPVSRAVAGGASINGRVAVPKNLRPRLTLIRPPHVGFRPRLAPFVQRHWRHPFFWAAVAGIGYLTIPDLYYDRFYGCVNADDPDYGCAVDLLSSAALNEEQATTRVRYPMPSTAAYRYSANVAPNPEAGSCNFDPFVERKWNHPFVWVQIPQIGNVTVPEDYYDRFYTFVGQEPPNYGSACKLLVEALAADTVAAATVEIGQGP
jgi:hypothetical protein